MASSRRSALGALGSTAVAIGAVGAGAVAWGSLVERTRYTLRAFNVPVLPAGAEPVRLLHLSDLHMAPWQRDKQSWVAALAQLNPDLIVNTGDNLGHENGLSGIRAAFDPFRGTPGVYVWGSNDYFGPTPKNPMRYFGGPSTMPQRPKDLDTAGLGRYLDGIGLTALNNTAAVLDVKGTRFEFFGVDDPHRGYDRLDQAADALRTLPDEQGTDAVRIGVAHAPYRRVLDDFVDHGAGLLLAGHTHGGQVCLPGFGALVTNCDLPRQQVKGLSRWEHGEHEAYLHVSAGLGTSIYAPFRFACRPEASLLTLVPSA
ncbi:metallophosphoesterase [Gryllotalpicola reticulitermitis]|uniref:Metallophosphoesterase n=1 Tax=Gryllotalpicola reticulitermitis TaxID=1184153 RepID=A0ABV8Q6Y2_9MICO